MPSDSWVINEGVTLRFVNITKRWTFNLTCKLWPGNLETVLRPLWHDGRQATVWPKWVIYWEGRGQQLSCFIQLTRKKDLFIVIYDTLHIISKVLFKNIFHLKFKSIPFEARFAFVKEKKSDQCLQQGKIIVLDIGAAEICRLNSLYKFVRKLKSNPIYNVWGISTNCSFGIYKKIVYKHLMIWHNINYGTGVFTMFKELTDHD